LPASGPSAIEVDLGSFGSLRREGTNTVILGLAKNGVPSKEIVRRSGQSRGLVRKVLRGQRSDVFRFGRLRSNCTCSGSTSNGPRDNATVLHCGGTSKDEDSVATFAS
jgi:hypothetical protein